MVIDTYILYYLYTQKWRYFVVRPWITNTEEDTPIPIMIYV